MILDEKIECLSSGSNKTINVKCDICEKEKMLQYRVYIKNTKNLTEPYCCSEKCANEKRRKTCLENNGHDNPMQNDKLKEKQNLAVFKNYGFKSPQQKKQVQDKTKKTNVERKGVEYMFQSKDVKEKIKKKILERFGVENVSQNNEIKQKKIETCKKNYGVDSPMQNKEIFEKQQKSAFKSMIHDQTGIRYQGGNEKDFLDYCFDNNIKIERGKTIWYKFEEKRKAYFPDFYYAMKNIIIEIKSTYTYKKELEMNLSKQKACIDQGYGFIFVVDKNYKKLNGLLS